MKRSLTSNGSTFFYTLKRSFLSKRLRILIKSSGDVMVTAPRIISLHRIELFLKDHTNWILEKLENIKALQKQTVLQKGQLGLHANSARARKLAHDRAAYFAAVYGVSYNRISIKNQSTQWGSCSSKKNLNFNYKIVFLPPDLADYVVVHEICHLLQMNHSPKFWKEVAKTFPNYREKIRALKNFKM